jgi:hypothetical protein
MLPGASSTENLDQSMVPATDTSVTDADSHFWNVQTPESLARLAETPFMIISITHLARITAVLF